MSQDFPQVTNWCFCRVPHAVPSLGRGRPAVLVGYQEGFALSFILVWCHWSASTDWKAPFSSMLTASVFSLTPADADLLPQVCTSTSEHKHD